MPSPGVTSRTTPCRAAGRRGPGTRAAARSGLSSPAPWPLLVLPEVAADRFDILAALRLDLLDADVHRGALRLHDLRYVEAHPQRGLRDRRRQRRLDVADRLVDDL